MRKHVHVRLQTRRQSVELPVGCNLRTNIYKNKAILRIKTEKTGPVDLYIQPRCHEISLYTR
jgi:hypothetical protein